VSHCESRKTIGTRQRTRAAGIIPNDPVARPLCSQRAFLKNPNLGYAHAALTVGGAEGDCWSSGQDTIVLGAIADLKTRLAINSRQVIIGGYSSGGNLGYPIIFRNSKLFALALFENTAPNGNFTTLLAAAAPPAGWRFPIRHLCHTEDTTFECADLRPTLGSSGSAVAAGHDSILYEMSGGHWEDAVNGRGTWPDFDAKLRPFLNQTFESPP
jgi:hypothetical protein